MNSILRNYLESQNNDAADSVQLSRRQFLKVSAIAGGGLLLSWQMPSFARDATTKAASFEPDAFIAIAPDGKVTVTVAMIEMGQGTYTSIPMLVAEELGVDMSQVTWAHAPPSDKLYANPIFGLQATGGSTTIRAMYVPMRKAGATARVMLVAAAAETWKAPVDQCTVAHGEVIHTPTGRKLSYGSLVAKAAKQPVPTDVKLKDPTEFKLIGTPAKRLDIAGKVDGTAVFGIDAQVPGMKLAGIVACPVFGGKVAKVDDSKAKAVKGVREVIVLDDAVAVVADHTGAVRKALGLLDITWDEGPNKDFTTAKWGEQLKADAKSAKVGVAKNVGDADKAIAAAPSKFSAVYQQPNLAHATMEPMNCTVRLTKTECEIWTGTQVQSRAQAVAAKLTGLPLESVKLHNALLGGGFGRRLETDWVEQAVRVAMKASSPIKLIWSREEDMRHDVYRPFYYDEMTAALDANGKPTAFTHRITGSSIVARWLPPGYKNDVDFDAVDAAESPYDFDNIRVEYIRSEPPAGVPTGFWRGVGPNHNAFVIEGFIDELAGVAKKDPVEFRRSILSKNPRAKAVLDTVAEKIGWGKKLPNGSGLGVAVINAWESFAALALEVAVDKDGSISVKHLVAAIDCGQQINPDTIVAQTQSGIIFGLTAALYGNITIDKGRVQQSNFHDYQMVRMNQVPPFEVHLIANHEKPGGMGEIATTLTSPALVNAIFAATGKRLRQLPIDGAKLKTA